VAPGPARGDLLALSEWPQLDGLADDKAEAEIGWVIDLITAIRVVRMEMNIPALKIPAAIRPEKKKLQLIARWRPALERLGRLSPIMILGDFSNYLQTIQKFFYSVWWRPNDFWRWRVVNIPSLRGAIQIVVRGEIVYLPLGGIIDLNAERARLDKELAKADSDIARVDAKLSNDKFVANAPEEVVEEEKEKREEAVSRKDKIAAALATLRDAT
jgi:valyl-tRNA synthetase